MKKKLDTAGITNELKGSSRFFSVRPVQHEEEDNFAPTPPQEKPRHGTQSTRQSTGQSTRQSAKQSTSQSTEQSTDPPYDRSPILGRPKSFYITQQQDRDIDLAVAKLAAQAIGTVNQKIDRSYLLRLLIEGAELTSDRTIERLHGRLIRRLVSQLTGRAGS